MDPMKTAPQWGPFLSSYMGGTTPAPAMKGVMPSERVNAGNPGDGFTCPPGQIRNSEGGCQPERWPCPDGQTRGPDGRCQAPRYADSGGSVDCPPPYRLDPASGQCRYYP